MLTSVDARWGVCRSSWCWAAIVSPWWSILNTSRSAGGIYAVVSNPSPASSRPARERVHAAGHVLERTLCGAAGLLYGARVGTSPSCWLPLGDELAGIRVIGGISVSGGSGTVHGGRARAVVWRPSTTGLVLLAVPEFWRISSRSRHRRAMAADVLIAASIGKP